MLSEGDVEKEDKRRVAGIEITEVGAARNGVGVLTRVAAAVAVVIIAK